jgi:arabinose-5-phosphate isomerase
LDSLKTGKEVLKKEAEALLKVMEKLDAAFTEAADILYQCTGRVVLTGMGKSGLVCKKIASTLSSTGTPPAQRRPCHCEQQRRDRRGS